MPDRCAAGRRDHGRRSDCAPTGLETQELARVLLPGGGRLETHFRLGTRRLRDVRGPGSYHQATMARPSAPRKLHTVSRVVLRRFTDGPNLLVVDLMTGRGRLVGPDGFGFTTRIRPADPHGFEAKWKQTEDLLPAVFDKADSGAVLGDPQALDLLRTCLAMHMARSVDLEVIDDAIFEALRPHYIKEIARDPRVAGSYPARHSGLLPAGSEALRLDAEAMYDRAAAGIENSPHRAERVEHFFTEALRTVRSPGLELSVADAGEFLISDAPALTLKNGHPGVGVRGGVPWPQADTIVMPIGRHRLISLGRLDTELHLSADQVAGMNLRQVAGANRWLAWHPGASFPEVVLMAIASRTRVSRTAARDARKSAR